MYALAIGERTAAGVGITMARGKGHPVGALVRAMPEMPSLAGLVLRAGLGAAYALDGLRMAEVRWGIGASRWAELGWGGHPGWVQALGWVMAGLGVGVWAGVLTRLCAGLPLAVVMPMLLASWDRVGWLGTSRALDASVRDACIIAIAAALVLHGPGAWSVDAVIRRVRGTTRT